MEKKQKCSGREIAGFLLIGLSLIMLGRSLMLCFSSDIWYDELFTVGMAEHSYGEMVRFTAADVHPPLYYCIVKLFVDLWKLIIPGAGTVIPAKIVSVLPYFILMIYAVTLIRKRFGIFVGGMLLFCVTAMPQLSAYTVEVRMYSWALLFVTAAFLHGCALVENDVSRRAGAGKSGTEEYYVNLNAEQRKCVDGGKDGAGETASVDDAPGRRQTRTRTFHAVAFVFYGLAAAYTQYFACVAVAMVYLFLLLAFWFLDRRRIREWLFYAAASVVCYVPWLFALAGQLGAVSGNYWILPLTWRSLGGCVKFLMKPAFADDRVNMVLAVILFAAYLGIWCRWLSKLCHYEREKSIEQEIWRAEKNPKAERRKKNGRDHGARTGLRKTDAAGTAERFCLATAGIGVLAGLVAFGFAASFLIRPIFVYRYMIPAAGCFWLGFALCLNEMLCKQDSTKSVGKSANETKLELCKPQKRFQVLENRHIGRHNIGRNTISHTVGIVITVLIVIVGLRDYRAFMGEEEYKIRLMAETEGALAMIGPQDSVLYNFDQVQAVTGYYLPETVERCLWRAQGESLIQEITSPCGTVEEVGEIREMLEKSQEEGREKSLWFIGSFNSREDIVEEWRGAGLEVEEMGSFLLERYWFNLYKIS